LFAALLWRDEGQIARVQRFALRRSRLGFRGFASGANAGVIGGQRPAPELVGVVEQALGQLPIGHDADFAVLGAIAERLHTLALLSSTSSSSGFCLSAKSSV